VSKITDTLTSYSAGVIDWRTAVDELAGFKVKPIRMAPDGDGITFEDAPNFPQDSTLDEVVFARDVGKITTFEAADLMGRLGAAPNEAKAVQAPDVADEPSADVLPAVVVLIPSDATWVTDPDPHLTVLYLGKPPDMPADRVVTAATRVQRMAGLTPPFDAKISGTGTLGKDQAKVALIESDTIAKIRANLEDLDGSEYPTFIPHITASYTGDMPDELPATVHFTKIAVWNGEDRTEWTLGGEPPQVG
jgi:hypothetical protein